MNKIIRILPKFTGLVYLIIFCAFFKAIAYWALTPYLPMYLSEFLGTGVENSGYMIGASSLVGMFMSIFCGYIIDRYDKTLVFIISLIIMAICYIIFPFISAIIVIVLLLMITSITSSSLSIVSSAWFSIELSEEESPKAFSLKYILENIGAMIGPVLGTVLISYDIRFPFIIAAGCLILTSIIFLVCSKFLVKSKEKVKIIDTESPKVKETFSSLLKDKRLLYFTIGGILSMMVYGALATFMSLFFSATLSYDIAYEKVAYISALNAGIVLITQYFVSSFIKKEKIIHWITFAILTMIIGLIILMFNSNFLWLTISVIFLSIGEVTIVPAEYLFIIKITPEDKRGVYMGTQNLIFLGLSLSPIICGYLLSNFGVNAMFITLCIILLVSLFFYSKGYTKSNLNK